MGKWKCEICGNEFENFHAQGFDNKIYCPLCYFKKENQELKQKYENAVADYETTMAEKNKLKKKLEVPETCNLKTLEDYKNYYEDTTREQILEDTYIEYCAYVNLAHRYSELKKQLEEKENIACNWKDSCLENAGKIEKLENQQKEFINYLEEYIEKLSPPSSYNNVDEKVVLTNVLIRYKEIIGDDK